MTNIKENLKKVRRRIQMAAQAANRDPSGIRVMAVTKKHPVEAIQAAMAAGHVDFGENFVQEARSKIEIVGPGPRWHFIGRIQSNKTKAVAEHFHWVHTVDRLRIAQRLSDQRPQDLPPLNVCLQVHLGDEISKGGVEPEEIPSLAKTMDPLPNLKLRGLMCLPPHSDDPQVQRPYFRSLRELALEAQANGFEWDTLSMGMSGDLESAVLEGATIVRVGTAIFGPRP